MSTFQRKKKDPAAAAYRQMAQERAAKGQCDFIGMTGKMDKEVADTDKYRRAEERFKAEIAKPVDIKEGHNGLHWYPSADHSSLETMNSLEPDHVAKKVEYLKHEVLQRQYPTQGRGSSVDEMYLPYSEKHKLITTMFHHDPAKLPTDKDFQSSKTPVDRVLEEMTRYRPNAENRERIRNGIDQFKKSDPELHKYLKDKYQFATTEDEVGPFKHYEPQERILTPEEINQHKDKFRFEHGRAMTEMDGTLNGKKTWQLHPDGTKTRVSRYVPQTRTDGQEHEDHPFQSDDELKGKDFHHTNLNELHGKFIKNAYYNDSIARYTNDSLPLNWYLAKGQLPPHAHETLAEHLEGESENLSSAMENSPPYAHKLQVWSGLSSSNDVGKYAAKKSDDKEKLIGHFPAFTSTSLNAKEAEGFAKPKFAEGFPHQQVHDLVKIEVPKAYHKGLYVDKASTHPGEYEYVLDKGHNLEFHPKPLFYVKNNKLMRVWKARPILSEDDKEIVQDREKKAREI